MNCKIGVRWSHGGRSLQSWFKVVKKEIVTDGALAGMGAHSYSKGDATGGSEEAVGKVGK